MKPVIVISALKEVNEYLKFNQEYFLPITDNILNLEKIEKDIHDFLNRMYGIENQLTREPGLENDVLLLVVRNPNDADIIYKLNDLIFKIAGDKEFSKINDILFFEIIGHPGEVNWDSYKLSHEKLLSALNKENKRGFSFIISQTLLNGNTISDKKNLYSQLIKFIELVSNNFNSLDDVLQYSSKEGFALNSMGLSEIIIPIEKILSVSNDYAAICHLDYFLSGYNFKDITHLTKVIDIDKCNNLLQNEESLDDYLTNNSYKPDGAALLAISSDEWINSAVLSNLTSPFVLKNLASFKEYFDNENPDSSTDTIEFDLNERKVVDNDEKFFDNISNSFKRYKNKILIQKEADCGREEKRRLNDTQEYINEILKKNLLKTRNEIKAEFGKTTSIELNIALLDVLLNGKTDLAEKTKSFEESDYSVRKKKTELFPQENIDYELNVRRKNILNSFTEKISSSKEAIKNLNDRIFEKLRQEKRLSLQLKFGLFDKGFSVFDKRRYTYLSKVSALSAFSVTILLALYIGLFGYSVSDLIKHLLIIGLPLIIGAYFLLKKLREQKRILNEIEQQIAIKKKAFSDLITSYDALVEEFWDTIKEEYLYILFIELEEWLEIRKYQLQEFRRYLFRHLFSSLKGYLSTDLNSNIFEFALIDKDQIISSLGRYIHPFFESEKGKDVSHDLWLTFLEKSNIEHDYQFKRTEYKTHVFEEIDPFEKVKPVKEHEGSAEYLSIDTVCENVCLFSPEIDKNESIAIDDIKQGNIGDCYYLASIGAISRTAPGYIGNMSYDNDNNTYTIRFYDGIDREVYVTVDNKFWISSGGQPVYADIPLDKKNYHDIWPMVLEKAWAKINGGYNEIVAENSRRIDFGIALTGMYIDFLNISSSSNKDEVLEHLRKHFIEKKLPVTFYSVPEATSETDPELVPQHAYALKDLSEHNTFNIFNPWGRQHFENKSIDFLLDNFTTVLLFRFKDSEKKISIPPDKIVKIIHRLDGLDDRFYIFNRDDFFMKLKNEITFEKLLFENQIDDEKLKNIGIRLSEFSNPLIDLDPTNLKISYHAISIFGKGSSKSATLQKAVLENIKPSKNLALDLINSAEFAVLQLLQFNI